jgi:hypothetical protein
MTEFRDLSKLPTNQEYWNRLEARITGELAPTVHALASARPNWWTPVATRAWALGGLAVAAGIAALLLLPPRALEDPVPSGLLRMPDDDPALIAFVSAAEPPALASLMIPSSSSGR